MTSRILFVDDEPHILESLADVWGLDFEVATAIDGPSALAMLDVWEPSVIVSDMRMPGMDGAAFLAAARARYPSAVRVLLTGQADLDAAGRAVNAGGIFKLLTKPCPHDLLHAALNEAVALHDQQARQAKVAGSLARAEHLATLGSLSAMMEHEVNNAVQLLGCAIESVEEAVGDDRVPERDVVEQLVRGRARLIAHARASSALSHRGSGVSAPIDIAEVLRSLAGAINDAGLVRTAELALDLEDDLVVVADRTGIDQVVLNIVKNALDAVPRSRGRIELSARRCDDRAEIVIADNGAGISAADLAHVFEPFFTTKPPTVGTGLGLPVARQLIHAFGGEIAIDSTVGVGTRVRITLPLAQELRPFADGGRASSPVTAD